jgi:hypothetical protein
MPTLTRWMIKTSLLYLVAALLTGAALAAGVSLAGIQPVYFHLLMVGWITQLIFGVVYWMFPKYSAERPRGSEAAGWASYALLNAGLVLRAVGEPLLATAPAAGPLLALAAVLMWLGGALFFANTWPRVKER